MPLAVHSARRESKSLLAGFSWIFLARIVYFGCQWGILVALAKLMGASTLGQWGLAIAITAPVFSFLEFKMRWIIATDSVRGVTIADHLALRFCSVVVSLVLVAVISIALGLSSQTMLLVAILAIAKSVESMIELSYGVMQRSETLSTLSMSLLIRGLCALPVVAVLLWLSESASIAALGMVVVWIVSLACWDFPKTRKLIEEDLGWGSISFSRVKQIVVFAAPLGIVALSTALGGSLPRLFLDASWGKEAVGYFTAIACAQVACNLFVLSLAQSAISRLSRLYHEDVSGFAKLLGRLISFGLAGGAAGALGAWILGSFFLSYAYGPDFSNWTGALVVIMIASTGASVNGLVGTTLLAVGKPRYWMVSTLVGLLACAVACWYLVPLYSVLGGALAIAISAWLSLTFSCWAMGRVLFESGISLPNWMVFRAAKSSGASGASASAQEGSVLPIPQDGRLRILHLVITANATSSPYNEMALPQSEKHDVTMCMFQEPKLSPPAGIHFEIGSGTVWGYLSLLRRLLKNQNFDVIHAHSPHVVLMFLLVAATVRGSQAGKLVHHVHNCYQVFRPRNRWMLLFGFAMAKRVLCCGKSSWESFPRLYRKLAGKRMRYVPNAVNLDRIERIRSEVDVARPRSSSFRIVCVAAFRVIKNHGVLLDAFARLESLDTELVLVGAGALEKDIRLQAESLGLANRIHFTGEIPRNEVYQKLFRSDLFVSVSLGEGLPVAVLEAMACGLPVVLSDIPPHQEIVEEIEAVRTVNPSDVDEIASELRRVLDSSEFERQAMGDECRKHIRRVYSLAVMLAGYERVYREVVGPYAEHEGDERTDEDRSAKQSLSA